MNKKGIGGYFLVNSLPTTDNHFKLLALKDYCFTQFRDINLILREDITEKKHFDKIYQEIYGEGTTTESMYNSFLRNIDLIDELFLELRNNFQLKTYRKFSKEKIPNLRIGDTYIDKGFVSTSVQKDSLSEVLHSDVLSYDSVAKIIVPPNTACVYIGSTFGRKESELLLNRGLCFKLLSIDENVFTFKII